MRKILGDKRLMLKCSVMYYEDQMGQSEIANKLGVSRPTVSKLLKQAKENGYVKIQINDHDRKDSFKLEKELELKYKLKEVIIVNDDIDINYQKEDLASEVVKFLYRTVKEKDIIGVSMGTTLKMIPKYINEKKFKELCFIPLIGGIGQSDMTTHSNQLIMEMSKRMGGEFKFLHAPAVVSNLDLISILKQDKSIKEIFELMENLNMAIVGIGNPTDRNSTVINTGYLNDKDFKTFNEKKAVGDICLNIYDENGDTEQYEYNKFVLGIDIKKLRNIDTVIGVACGIEKVNAIRSALKGKYINVLAINYSLAKLL